ncbi:F-box/LRR-repeat protein At3g58900-like [Trifolium pratense]|uniref:F-box/LRR-repeat protein At3g58900-like n=1 Tax=Trifolium pratense TaxID=57577 RepID=UPI001E690A72|nr:F-box/LRR-repeat protein At3g58900-like [Trifolium pratense]
MDDHISELPDDILSYILTMLSIKDLLKTSVLSKRWRKLWGLRKHLYFDIYNVLGTEKELLEKGYLTEVTVDIVYSRTYRCVNLDLGPKEFIKRVDQFLNNFPGTAIDSFFVNFYFDCEQSNTIDRWICFAIARGVERINLLFRWWPYTANSTTQNKLYKLDFGLFTNTITNVSTLKHLRLEKCLVCHPTNCDLTPFKHLRSLSLKFVKVDEIFIESLLSNCQLLRELSLVHCEFNSSTPKIVSSSLYHLKVSGCCKVSSNNFTRFIRLMLVDCFRLTSLECCGNDLSALNTNTRVLKRINFSIYFDEIENYLNAFALCATFPELEIMRLKIYTITMDLLQVATSLKIAQPLEHLKQLDCIIYLPFDTINEECDLMMIFNILQASPLLQKLSIMIAEPKFFEKQKDIRDVEIFSHDEIKVIEFGGCVGNWFEIEFVMNILKYAHKLEQIVVSPYFREDDSSNWMFDPLWFQSGRERMIEKLQGEEVVGREKLMFI